MAKTKAIFIRMDENQHAKIKKFAERNNLTMTCFIVRSADYFASAPSMFFKVNELIKVKKIKPSQLKVSVKVNKNTNNQDNGGENASPTSPTA